MTGHAIHRREAACTLRCRAGPCARTARPLACRTGCHLRPCAVKGRCALMSARYAFGVPLTAPGPRRPGESGRPGRARSTARPAGEGGDAHSPAVDP